MAVRLITDSASDLPLALEKEFQAKIVPLTVNFGENEHYKDRFEITSEEFFKKLADGDVTPFTSQVNPGEFEVVFKEVLENGDDIVGVFLSAELSGTYNSAVLARESLSEYRDRIHLVDSESVSLGLSLLIKNAGRLVQKGLNAKEVAVRLENMKRKMETIIVVDTLEYLRKGGRLSAGAAFIGSVLNLKPILTIKDGKLVAKDKVRGRKKAIKWIKDWIDENKFVLADKTVFLVHAAAAEYMEELKIAIESTYQPKEILFTQVGGVVGTHSGPGAIGICFIND
ncbi:DegV family protein [Alkalibacter rhizosphaerae]|uniref:DegV family protein n=1 Tax=Alkalibacter rhizosphaerae TaxID=2815577 RepID=A0A975AHC8_9FIRM|nr:DegV family protein [Alkalibacter rhizosphaerae]QSX08317.1 DegV family protein [Alkalibacter rhizosphaerae]